MRSFIFRSKMTDVKKDGGAKAFTASASVAKPEPESIEEVLKLMVEAAREKFAENIQVLDVTEVLDYVDYIFVAQGQTAIQNRAIADRIIDSLKEYDIILSSLQGYRNADWILIDYDNVVVHVFLPDAREFYQLEELFSEGKELLFD